MADEDTKKIADGIAKQTPKLSSIADGIATLAANSETPESRRERELRESKRDATDKATGAPGKTKGFLGMIKALGAGIGKIASVFLGAGKFLLVKGFGIITGLAGAILSVKALVVGLVAIAALFAGVTIASFMLTKKEFDELKEKIAGGVANVFQKIVEGAVAVYNKFVPASMEVSEADKKKLGNATFTNVKASVIKIIGYAETFAKFFKEIVASFSEGFDDHIAGIKTKSKDFVDKIKIIYEMIVSWFSSASDWLMTVDGKAAKKTLMDGFKVLGDVLGTFIEGILSVANFIVDMVIDPTVTFAKFQASIENSFNSMGANIGDYLEGMFSKENIMKMLQGMLGEDSLAFKGIELAMGDMEEVAAEAQKEREEHKKKLQDNRKLMIASANETKRQLNEELALGDKRDSARVRALTLAFENEKGDIESNKAQLERTEEKILRSKKLQIEEKISDKMGDVSRALEVKNAELKEEIAADTRRMMNKQNNFAIADVSGANEGFSSEAFAQVLKAVQKMQPGVTAEQLASGDVKLNQKAIDEIHRATRTTINFAKDNLTDLEDQSIIFKAGLKLQAKMAKQKAAIDLKQAEVDKTDLELKQKRTTLTEIEMGKLKDATEIVKKYIPDSGVVINQLEKDKQSNQQTATIVNTDASQTIVNNTQNQTIMSVPHPGGQALPG